MDIITLLILATVVLAMIFLPLIVAIIGWLTSGRPDELVILNDPLTYGSDATKIKLK